MSDSAFAKAAAIPLLQTHDIRLVESDELHAVMEVTVSEKHANYYGGAHGGLLAALADTACFFPLPLIPSDTQVTTVNLNLNYMRPVSLGERLRVRADLLRLGRRTANLNVSIVNEAGKQVVQGTAVLMILEEQNS